MRHQTKVIQILVAWVVGLSVAVLPWAGSTAVLTDGQVEWLSAQAQDEDEQRENIQSRKAPTLQITEIDIQSFPVVRVFVYGENLPDALDSLPIRLEEDRVEQPLVESQAVEVGTQTAIVLDASRNILSTGNTGTPRLDEISRAVGRFVQLGLLSAQTDWLAAYGTGSVDGEYEIIADWQQDHQGVVNSLIQWRPDSRPVITSLFGVVQAAFEQFETTPAPANVRRSMVIFSDGADIVSNIETDDIVRMAQQQGVHIHTVLLGTPARDSRRNLGRLADLTDGLFIELNGITDLDPIWRTIGSERVQQLLTYRLSQAQPREILVAAQGDGREVFATSSFPVVGARPVEVQILTPTADQSFSITSTEAGDSQSSVEQNLLPIQVAFNWPDGRPRDFHRVEYSLDADTRTVTSPPFDQFSFPVANVTEGHHTIRVTAVDELGISSISAPLSIPFQLAKSHSEAADGESQSALTAETALSNESQAVSALPAPQSNGLRIGNFVLPSSVQIAGYTIPLDLPTLGIILVPSLLLISVILLVRNRSRASNPYFASEHSTTLDPYSDLRDPDPNVVTVPSMSAFEMDEVSTEPVRMLEFDVVAHLVLHSGATHLPERFPLFEGQQIRIGRHSSYSDIILEDTRVSRQHSTIEWESGGHVIRDEGSAGGTYLNKRRLGVGDKRPLQEGDIINFNEIAYRYEIVLDSLSDKSDDSLRTRAYDIQNSATPIASSISSAEESPVESSTSNPEMQ